MAEAERGDRSERCRALTASGERCSREAQDDGFCYQHDESDETVDGAAGSADDAGDKGSDSDMSQTESETADEETQQESEEETEETEEEPEQDAEETQQESEETQQESEESQQETEETDEQSSSSADGIDLWDARDTAERVADELIDDPFDGIVEISKDDDAGEWHVVVEVIERRSIPDTQDILGRYEVTVGSSGDLEGYRLTGRYRRGDVSDEQAPEQ